MIQYGLAVLWRGGFCSAAFSALLLSIVWSRRRSPALSWLAGGTIGYLGGHVALSAIDRSWGEAIARLWRPSEGLEWLPMVAFCAAAIELATRIDERRQRLFRLLAIPLAVAVATRLLWGSRTFIPSQELRDAGFVPDAWTPLETATGIFVMAICWTAVVFAWWAQPSVEQPRLRSLLAVITSVAAASFVASSGSLVYAAHFGLLASLLTGSSMAAWFRRVPGGPEHATALWSFLFGSLLLLSTVYANLSGFSVAMLIIAWTSCSGKLPRAIRRTPRRHARWRLGMCLVAICAASGKMAYEQLAEYAPAAEKVPENSSYQLLK